MWNGLVLAIGGAVFAAIALFYNLNSKKYCEIMKEIDARKAAE